MASNDGPLAGVTHQPKIDIITNFKVIRFGEIYIAGSVSEQRLYCFRHQRADLKCTEGCIPVSFYSKMWLGEGQPIFLETRCGGFDVDNQPVGPEYQVSWRTTRDILPPTSLSEDGGWNNNLDELWIQVLSYFERKSLLSEDTLDYLDADPFVLFGIDDHVTQQALRKLEKFPACVCEGIRPSQDDWRRYLRIHPHEETSEWLVEALADCELPAPWTCYKGAGSIVCFIRSDTGQVTWKHPFYDYFRQMRDFCRQASREEIMQVRVNRLLWSYEATRIETEHYQEPLLAPEYIDKIAKIFGYDVKTEGCIVRNLKAILKVFATTYRNSLEIDIKDVVHAAETLEKDCEKYAEMKHEWNDAGKDVFDFALKDLSRGEITCVNCESIALAFCLECKDYLCLNCYDNLHQKGARKQHAPFRLVACCLCVEMPAKLHCTFTDKSMCHKCYALKHVRLLPPDGKENEPRRIDYAKQYIRYATFARDRQVQQKKLNPLCDDDVDEYGCVLSTDWHPFYDSRGVKFFHNFLTGERMRQNPQRVPNAADAGAPEERNHHEMQDIEDGTVKPATRSLSSALQPLELTGFNSLSTGNRATSEAVTEPKKRNMLPPHRINMPHEVPPP